MAERPFLPHLGEWRRQTKNQRSFHDHVGSGGTDSGLGRGDLILIVPRVLNYVVALYLIIIGIIGLLPHITNVPI